MESHIRTIFERIRRVNRDYNTSDKYLDYFQNENDFYNKICNRLDDFISVSHWLVKFLISTPPLINDKGGYIKNSDNDEELADYDDKSVDTYISLHFANKDFDLKELDDLPVEMESEFDFNYLLFYSFISYLKPANYFIHEHELVPYPRKETLKENITRVLANLVQLLIFIRSFESEDSSDLRIVTMSLIYHFNELFTIKKNHDKSEEVIVELQSFLVLYPQISAQLIYFLIAYDKPPESESLDEFKQSLDLVMSVFANTSKYQDYQYYLTLEAPILMNTLNECSTVKDYQEKIRNFFHIKDLKSSLLELAFTLSNKTIIQINNTHDWKLDSYLSINHSKETKELKTSYEEQIASLRDNIEKEIENKNSQMINELRTNLLNREEEVKILREQLRLRGDEIDDLKAKLHLQLDKQSSNSVMSYSDFEEKNPELHKKIKTSVGKLFLSKCYGKIDELQKKVISLENQLESNKSSKEKEATRLHSNNPITNHKSQLSNSKGSDFRVEEFEQEIDSSGIYDQRYENRDECYGTLSHQDHSSAHSHGQIVIASPPQTQHMPQEPPGASKCSYNINQHLAPPVLVPSAPSSQRYKEGLYDNRRSTNYYVPNDRHSQYQQHQNSYYLPNRQYRY